MYGPVVAKNREALWGELRSIRNAWEGPWAIGGDFNVIRFIHEKSPPGVMTRSMRDFNEFVQGHALRDICLTNAKFTWTNG